MTPEKQAVLNFMATNTLATISTVNSDHSKPESALIAFAELENLEILFLTLEGSRKYVNLLTNDNVAMVIGWDPDPKRWATLQYEGKASQIKDEDYQKYKDLFSRKKDTPCTEDFFLTPGMKLFKVTPTWIGYSDFTKGKPRVIEIKDF